MVNKLNISLEAHLQGALEALLQVLPEETSQRLTLCLSSERNETKSAPVIPYELILKMSRWCQTADGKAALQACAPPLNPQSYTMVSLLAGARTSPEKYFPPYMAKDPEAEQHLQARDKKAIATLANAVLTVVGSGIATWWASGQTGMRLEWRALLAMSAALVVALAEIVLYVIWDSRQVSTSRQPTRKHIVVRRKDTTESSSNHEFSPQASSTAVRDTNILHRNTALMRPQSPAAP